MRPTFLPADLMAEQLKGPALDSQQLAKPQADHEKSRWPSLARPRPILPHIGQILRRTHLADRLSGRSRNPPTGHRVVAYASTPVETPINVFMPIFPNSTNTNKLSFNNSVPLSGPNGPFTAGRNVHYIDSLGLVKNNFRLFAALLLALFAVIGRLCGPSGLNFASPGVSRRQGWHRKTVSDC